MEIRFILALFFFSTLSFASPLLSHHEKVRNATDSNCYWTDWWKGCNGKSVECAPGEYAAGAAVDTTTQCPNMGGHGVLFTSIKCCKLPSAGPGRKSSLTTYRATECVYDTDCQEPQEFCCWEHVGGTYQGVCEMKGTPCGP